MQIRRTGSDWYVTDPPYVLCRDCLSRAFWRLYKADFLCRKVLQGVINDYAEFLKKLLPWSPKTVLEGGGNIGSSSPDKTCFCRVQLLSSILGRQLS